MNCFSKFAFTLHSNIAHYLMDDMFINVYADPHCGCQLNIMYEFLTNIYIVDKSMFCPSSV